MASSAVEELLSIGLIEKDSNGDVLWTWSYPSVSDVQRNVVLRKCGLLQSGVGGGPNHHHHPHHHSDGTTDMRQINFIFSHFQRNWFYMNTTEVFEADHLSRVKQFVLVLWARDFNPEKYETLCRILSKTYCKTGSTTAIVSLYLSVVTRGSCSTEENGTFLIKDFEQRKAYANANIKAIINTFKLETILIYTALILKKRIVVYHHRLDCLLAFLRVLPAFVWHRQNWEILYPYVDLNNEELDDLKAFTTYAAGFLDAAIEARSDLYDVFINLAAVEITVASHAKGNSFMMSKIHKDIALAMVRCAEDEDISEHQTIKEIANKTSDLLDQLNSLASTVENGDHVPRLNLDKLKEHKLAPALETFLFNLAVAENINFV